MSHPLRRRVLAFLLPVVLSACTTDATPVPAPGEGFSRVDNRVRGLTSGSLLAAFTSSDNTTWVGGALGALLRRSPGGDWQLEPIPVEGIVTGIAEDASGHLLVVAGSGLLRRALDEPLWQDVAIPNDAILLDLWGYDREHLFIGGAGGTILRRVGEEWLRAVTPVGTEVWGLAGDGPDNLVAVGQDGIILESGDDGATWIRVTSPTTSTLFAVASDGAGRIVAVGSQGTVLLREGDTWEESARPTEHTLFDVRSSGPGEFLAVGDGGQLFEGDGITWRAVTTAGVRENFRAITGPPGKRTVAGWFGTLLDEGRGWGTSETGTRIYGLHAPPTGNPIAVGQGGVGFERRNGAWQPLFIPSSASLLAIDGPGANDRLAVGDSGTVLHFDGTTWRAEARLVEGMLRSVWYDGRRAMAVGAGGVVLLRENGTWRTFPSGTTAFLRHVAGKSWQELYVAGDDGTLLRWNGEQFHRIALDTDQHLRATLMRNSRDVYVVGDVGTLFHFDGWRWTRQFSPTLNDIRSIHEVDGHLYLGGDFGQIWRHDGTEWKPLPVDQLGFWLQLGGRDELIAVGEVGTIAEGVR